MYINLLTCSAGVSAIRASAGRKAFRELYIGWRALHHTRSAKRQGIDGQGQLTSRQQGSPLPADDPKQRKPDITRAGKVLNWRPKTSVADGLKRAVHYFKQELGLATAADEPTPDIWMPAIADKLDRAYLAQ